MAGNDCHNTNYMRILAILESPVANNIRYMFLGEEIMWTLYNRSEWKWDSIYHVIWDYL